MPSQLNILKILLIQKKKPPLLCTYSDINILSLFSHSGNYYPLAAFMSQKKRPDNCLVPWKNAILEHMLKLLDALAVCPLRRLVQDNSLQSSPSQKQLAESLHFGTGSVQDLLSPLF